MAENKTNNVNIESVIEGVKTLSDSYVKITSILNKSIDKMSESEIDAKRLKIFNSVNNVTSSYMEIITSSIKSLSDAAVPQGGDIGKLLGYITIASETINTKDDKTGELKTTQEITGSKFVVIDGLIQMTQVFSAVNKLIEGIVKADLDKNIVKSKANISLFTSNINSLMNSMISSLANLSNSLNQEDIKRLMGDEMSSKISEYTKVTDKVTNGEDTKSIINKATENSSKTYGIIDVFERYIALMSSLSTFKAPSLIGTLIEIRRAKISMETVLSSLGEILKYADNSGLSPEKVDQLGKTFESINSVFSDSVLGIASSLKFLSKTLTSRRIDKIEDALQALYSEEGRIASGILVAISKILTSEEMVNIAQQTKDDSNLMKAKTAISTLTSIMSELTTLSDSKNLKALNQTERNLKKLKTVIESINSTIDQIVDAQNKNVDKLDSRKKAMSYVTTMVSELKDIVDSISDASKSLSIMTLLFIPTLLGLLCTVVIVKAFTLLVKALRGLTLAAKRTDYSSIEKQMIAIRSVILSIAVSCLAIIAISIIAPLVLRGIKDTLLAIGAILLVITVVGSVLWALSRMEMNDPKMVALKMLAIVATIFMINLIMLELLLIQITVQQIEWAALGKSLLLLGSTIGVILLIGLLVSNPFVMYLGGLAAVGFAVIVFTLGCLITILLELIAFNKIASRLDDKFAETVQNKVENIVSIVSTISTSIWDSYKEGSGILKTAITAMWLATTILSVGAMILVAGMLWLLVKVVNGLDSLEVQAAVKTVLDLSNYIVDVALGGKGVSNPDQQENPEAGEQKSRIGSLLKGAGTGILQIVDTMLMFVNLLGVTLSVALLFGITLMLKGLVKFASTLDTEAVQKSVQSIIGCAQSIRNIVFAPQWQASAEEMADQSTSGKAKAWFKNITGKAAGVVKGVVDGIGNLASAGILATVLPSVIEITTLVDLLEKISKFEVEEEAVTSKVDQIIRLSSIVSAQISSSDNVVNTISDTKVKSFSTYANDSIKFMQQINKLDADKLVKYSDMWVKMTEFMDTLKDVPIEELSEAIVNKIAPAVDKISNTEPAQVTSQTASLAQPNPPAPQGNAVGDPTANTANKVTNVPEPIDYTSILQGIKEAVEDILQQRMMG